MSFPSNPSAGDTFTREDTVWTFNGRNWDRTKIGAHNDTRYAHNLVTTALLTRIAHLEALVNDGILLLD